MTDNDSNSDDDTDVETNDNQTNDPNDVYQSTYRAYKEEVFDQTSITSQRRRLGREFWAKRRGKFGSKPYFQKIVKRIKNEFDAITKKNNNAIITSRWYKRRQHRQKVGSNYSFFEKGETVHEAFFEVLNNKTITEVAKERNILLTKINKWKAKGLHLLYYQSLEDPELQGELKRTKRFSRVMLQPKCSQETFEQLTAYFLSEKGNGRTVSVAALVDQAKIIEPDACLGETDLILRRRMYYFFVKYTNVTMYQSSTQQQLSQQVPLHDNDLETATGDVTRTDLTTLGCREKECSQQESTFIINNELVARTLMELANDGIDDEWDDTKCYFNNYEDNVVNDVADNDSHCDDGNRDD